MNKTVRKHRFNFLFVGKIAGTMAGSALLCMLILFLTGLIPQSAIADSCRESAAYFKEHELFPFLVDGQFNTITENYGDCIVVNIMYHISDDKTMESLLKAYYYNPERESVEVSLWDSLQEEKEPNVGYFRYWHGEMVLMRPLFTFTGIEGTRGILSGILILLTIGIVFLLWHQRAKVLAICYLLGNLIVQFWVCFFSIGHITMFLLMNIMVAIVIGMFKQRKNPMSLYRKIYLLMAASGVYTCFFDFLTTETLTITVPLLILLVLRYEAGELDNLGKEVKRFVICGTVWLVSYGSMFLLKWFLAAGILGRQAFFSAMQSAGERIGGEVRIGNTNLHPVASDTQRFLGSLWRNWGSLFPFRNKMSMSASVACFLGVIFVCFAVVYILRWKNFSMKMILLCLLLGMVPYLRYIVLENHSYNHYFFTYRAQLVTVIALLYVTYEFGVKNLIKKK